MDVQFDAEFAIGDQTITRTIYLLVAGSLADDVSFDLEPGDYTLDYSSPYGSGSVDITVESGPDIVVITAPDNLSLSPGANTWDFTLKNTGDIEGSADFYLMMPDWEDSQYDWLEVGEEKVFSFDFVIPDDLEEKDYTAYYKINDEEFTLGFSVAGPKVEVAASLDKDLYAEGETAVLTLDITNTSTLDIDLSAVVNLGEYEATEDFSLTGGGVDSLEFNVPIDFDTGKLFYGIYVDSGRALHLNALYINERTCSWTVDHSQVYDIGIT